MVYEHVLPTGRELRDYLRFYGWVEQAPGPAGAIWSKNDARIGMPFESDDSLLQGIVERIARAENQSAQTVAREARYLLFDVTYLRAAHDYRIADTIPLHTAARIIAAGRAMLRATATTARRERAQIGSSYSRLGDDVVREARMGHTERGSFVIPILVPLPHDGIPERLDEHLFSDHNRSESVRVQPESFERRVVRTFAQSMQAVREILVDPAKDPTADQVHELVYRGVSREFCSALAGVLEESAVAEFETTVDWATAVPAPETMPKSVVIDADAADLVKRCADKLRQGRISTRQIFSGSIVQLRHERQDDPYGEIAISTMRRGRPAEIQIRLPIDSYRRAWEWHNAGRAVLVEGAIRRSPGRQSIVDSPVRCHPVDEMYLQESTEPEPFE